MSALIEQYGLIGDRESAALVRDDGAIDWLCWPRFDSDALFCALLGDAEHGSWRIGPTGPARASRRYQSDTLVIETDFVVSDAAARVIDFMPPRRGSPALVRLVVGLRGELDMRCDLRLRFDYGKVPPWTEKTDDGLIGRIGPDLVVLRSPVPLAIGQGDAIGSFRITAGQRLAFVLQHGDSSAPPPSPVDAAAALLDTQRDGRDWIARFDRPTRWPDAVRRSLLTLRALTHPHTGGLIAAATTSLPEKPGGALNWDYRYCWLRDATFTITALLNAGYHQEAQHWRDWILRALAGTPEELRIMYRVDGGRHINEWTVDWLPGYRWSRPVRVGNAASDQRQLDVLGEVVDAFATAVEAGLEPSPHERVVSRAIVDRIETIWREPDQGMWESRGQPRRYTYSKVMAWVGVDRFLRQSALHAGTDAAVLRRLAALRERIHADICANGYHPGLGTFVSHFGGQELDADLLLLPIFGFLPAEDPRIAATITGIERELMHDGLVMRRREPGFEPEGAFLACTCWLADCRALQHRHAEAREALERVLAVRNDLGLLSEEYNLRGRHLSGNFPQALSHLAVVMTALRLSGSAPERGGD